MHSTDIAIVGGGVIGLAIAHALALRGAGNITVIERSGFGGEASSAAAGMLAPQAEADHPDDFLELACRSRDLYSEFAAALKDETGIDIELDETGTLYLALSDEDESKLERRFDWQQRAGLPVERLTAKQAGFFEPCISPATRLALRFPRDLQVENRRLLNALIESSKELNVQLLSSTTVNTLLHHNRRISGLETANGKIAAGTVVIAAGAWTGGISPADKALPNLGIEPVRGQMVCFGASPRLTRHVIYSARGYLVPRMDGRLLAGSTTEDAGFDKRVTATGIESIISHAREIAPAISQLSMLDYWAGLRPKAADGLPVLGPYAEIDGLFYATGHYRNGILLAPITGELIADAITTQKVDPLIKPFTPDRFLPLRVNHEL